MASTTKVPESVEEILSALKKKGASVTDTKALEEAFGTSAGRDLLRKIQGLSEADTKTFFADTKVTAESLLGDARTGIHTSLHEVFSATNDDFKIKEAFTGGNLNKDVQAYIDAEVKLARDAQGAVERLARKSSVKSVLDDALAKFGSEMPKKYGSESINAWARRYEDVLDKISDTAPAEEKEAAKQAAKKAREIADKLADEISHVKDAEGNFKKAEGYGRELQKMSRRSKELGTELDEAAKDLEKDFNKGIEKVEEAYRDIKKDIRKTLKLDGPQHSADKMVEKVSSAADKYGKVEGEFVERFASKATKAASGIGETASKTTEEVAGWFRHDKNKGFGEKVKLASGEMKGNLKKGPAFIAGTVALGTLAWALGAFKSKHPDFDQGMARGA